MSEEKVGYVSNYFGKISVAAIEITDGTLAVGDSILILGHTTEFETTVHSMQIDHKQVSKARQGDSVGVKVPEKAREGDRVFKVVAD